MNKKLIENKQNNRKSTVLIFIVLTIVIVLCVCVIFFKVVSNKKNISFVSDQSQFISAYIGTNSSQYCFIDNSILMGFYYSSDAEKSDKNGLYLIKNGKVSFVTHVDTYMENISVKGDYIYWVEENGKLMRYNYKTHEKRRYINDAISSYGICGNALYYSKYDLYDCVSVCKIDLETGNTKNIFENDSGDIGFVTFTENNLFYDDYRDSKNVIVKCSLDGKVLSSVPLKKYVRYTDNDIEILSDDSESSEKGSDYYVFENGIEKCSFTVDGGTGRVAYKDGKVFVEAYAQGIYIYDAKTKKGFLKEYTFSVDDKTESIEDMYIYKDKIYLFGLLPIDKENQYVYWTMDPNTYEIKEVRSKFVDKDFTKDMNKNSGVFQGQGD